MELGEVRSVLTGPFWSVLTRGFAPGTPNWAKKGTGLETGPDRIVLASGLGSVSRRSRPFQEARKGPEEGRRSVGDLEAGGLNYGGLTGPRASS